MDAHPVRRRTAPPEAGPPRRVSAHTTSGRKAAVIREFATGACYPRPGHARLYSQGVPQDRRPGGCRSLAGGRGLRVPAGGRPPAGGPPGFSVPLRPRGQASGVSPLHPRRQSRRCHRRGGRRARRHGGVRQVRSRRDRQAQYLRRSSTSPEPTSPTCRRPTTWVSGRWTSRGSQYTGSQPDGPAPLSLLAPAPAPSTIQRMDQNAAPGSAEQLSTRPYVSIATSWPRLTRS